MRTWILLGSLAALSACGSSGSGNDVTCGDGTTLVGDSCEPGGSGAGDTCGSGTHLDGTTCVADGSGSAAGAPTIATIDPPDAGVSGNVLFTITGTGFAGSNVSSLHVYFGDTTPGGDCEAQVGAATSTTIAGEVPSACDLNVIVTVTTNNGSATIPFHYDALIAADGDGGGQAGAYGDLYVIDPYAQVFFDLGVMNDGTNGYGMSGIAFASDGTLYGVTTGDSPADLDGFSQLVTIDLGTATVTPIGDAVAGNGDGYWVTDIKVSGTTIYGWAYDVTNNFRQSIVTIDTTTGAVTAHGPAAQSYYVDGGIAFDGTGTLYVAANGASADPDDPAELAATGELDTANTTSGALTMSATLDYGIGAPVNALAYFTTDLLAVVDNGTYGMIEGEPLYGETLALIDTSQTPIVSPLFELPAQIGAQSAVDALAVPPAAFTIARTLPRARWQTLKATANAPSLRHAR